MRRENGLVATRLGDGGDPPAVALGDGRACGANEPLVRRLWDLIVDQIDRRIDEDSRRLAVARAHDAAARRIRRRFV